MEARDFSRWSVHWFVGIEKRDEHAHLFNNSDIEKTIFTDRNEAVRKVKEAEKNNMAVSEETYYEEY